jgi:fatty-acyl-CoA synthase
VVIAPDARLDLSDLSDFLTSRLGRYKIPKYLDVVESLPRTGSNKVQKAPLRKLPLPS